MSHQLRRNIEIKAHCDDLSRARSAAEALGAKFAGVLNQVDTYFDVPRGRLKLRQVNDAESQLISYHRPNEPTARESQYRLVAVADAELMLATLGAALRIRVQVRKRRELLLWHNVRIHLDTVERLGAFIEFEAVLSDDSDEATSRDRLETLSRALKIGQQIAGSYSDLLGI